MKYNFDQIIDRRNSYSKKWLKYRDSDVIAMTVADMEFSAPPPILNALAKEIDHGVLGYTLYQMELKQTVISYLKDQYSWDVQEEEIIWLPSIVAGMNICSRILTTNNQPIISATPIYPPFFQTATNSQRQLIKTQLILNEHWEWDFADLEKQLAQNKTDGGLLLLCNPHNPTGRVWSRNELERLLDIASRYKLNICSDEIHCDLILDKNLKHIPFASLNSEAATRSIVLMSPAKTFNIPGLSCAFAVIQNSIIRENFETYMRGLYPQINIMGLIACKTALTECQEWKNQLIEYLQNNHNLTLEKINKMPGLVAKKSEATYLLWINCKEFCDKTEISNPFSFFEKHGIALGNGADFGMSNYFRLNFACPKEQLTEALHRIEDALKKA